MNFEKVVRNDIVCAVVHGDDKVITDTSSALDLLMSAKYEVGTKNIAISKSLITDDFFILSSGFAGEMLQKYINYGDYSHYTSKPLRDFIYESNKGSDIFFVATLEEAVEKLTK